MRGALGRTASENDRSVFFLWVRCALADRVSSSAACSGPGGGGGSLEVVLVMVFVATTEGMAGGVGLTFRTEVADLGGGKPGWRLDDDGVGVMGGGTGRRVDQRRERRLATLLSTRSPAKGPFRVAGWAGGGSVGGRLGRRANVGLLSAGGGSALPFVLLPPLFRMPRDLLRVARTKAEVGEAGHRATAGRGPREGDEDAWVELDDADDDDDDVGAVVAVVALVVIWVLGILEPAAGTLCEEGEGTRGAGRASLRVEALLTPLLHPFRDDDDDDGSADDGADAVEPEDEEADVAADGEGGKEVRN